MNAIPTHYNGINFRSRLEAKWARFFDLLGWPYEYEPIDLSGYIPDFVLKFDTPIAVEIKPAFTRSELQESAGKAHAACKKAGIPLLCLGATLLSEATRATVGLGLIDNLDSYEYGIEIVEFSWCTHHKGYALYTPEGSWHCLRCGGKCQEKINKPYWYWNCSKVDKAECDNSPATADPSSDDFFSPESLAIAAWLATKNIPNTQDTDTINQFWSKATNSTQYKRIFQSGKD